MSADRDLTPIVHTWLEQRGRSLVDPYQGFDRFLELVEATPQVRRRRWALGRPSATTGPTGRSPSMFSATRLIALAAIVALGTGSLFLAGGQSPSPVPTASPSPTLTLVTQPIEPGVERILSDGIRDLTSVGTSYYSDGIGDLPSVGTIYHPEAHRYGNELAIGPDASVWLGAAQALIRLGDPRSYPLEGLPIDSRPRALKVAPDGSLWAQPDGILHRFDGERWSRIPPVPEFSRFDVAADGTVWAAGRGASLSRLDTTGWTDHPIDLDPASDVARSVDLTADSLAAVARARTEFPVTMVRADVNGTVWAVLAVEDPIDSHVSHVLLRFDGLAWSAADPLGAGSYFNVDLLDIGLDGTVWVYLETRTEEEDEPSPYLARLADDQWTIYSKQDGVLPAMVRGEIPGVLRVGPDGTVWMTQVFAGPYKECRGIRAFDGTTWRRYLDGDCVVDLEIAADGSVWVLTGQLARWLRNVQSSDDLYRIDPTARSGGS